MEFVFSWNSYYSIIVRVLTRHCVSFRGRSREYEIGVTID